MKGSVGVVVFLEGTLFGEILKGNPKDNHEFGGPQSLTHIYMYLYYI